MTETRPFLLLLLFGPGNKAIIKGTITKTLFSTALFVA